MTGGADGQRVDIHTMKLWRRLSQPARGMGEELVAIEAGDAAAAPQVIRSMTGRTGIQTIGMETMKIGRRLGHPAGDVRVLMTGVAGDSGISALEVISMAVGAAGQAVDIRAMETGGGGGLPSGQVRILVTGVAGNTSVAAHVVGSMTDRAGRGIAALNAVEIRRALREPPVRMSSSVGLAGRISATGQDNLKGEAQKEQYQYGFRSHQSPPIYDIRVERRPDRRCPDRDNRDRTLNSPQP